MPLSIQIDDEGDVRAKLNRIKNTATGVQARQVAGLAMAGVVREHLYRKDNNEPNKLGSSSRTHFYRSAADSTNYRVSTEAITINISKRGIRQRYKGGKIEPGSGKKYLTIPIHADAHGKRSGEFSLEFAYRRKAGAGLTIFLGQSQGESGFKYMYVLKPEIYQKGDSTVLPDSKKVLAAGMSAIEDYIASQEHIARNN